MCRNIRSLFNFDPPATREEIHDAALQFVRKLSGFSRPSRANEAAFARAVDEVASAAETLLASLVTTAEPRNREVEAMHARARAAERFGTTLSRSGRGPDPAEARSAPHRQQEPVTERND